MTRTKGARNIPWEAIVQKLREHPGRWLLLPAMRSVPIRTIEVIRRRQRRQLRLDDGKIYCRQRAIAQTDDGVIRCTLVLKFVPTPKEKVHGEEVPERRHPPLEGVPVH